MYEPLDPSMWNEFFFTVGAASAALIGLIVVGLSIRAEYIAGTPVDEADPTSSRSRCVVPGTPEPSSPNQARSPSPAWTT
jgi:hypothetical protein